MGKAARRVIPKEARKVVPRVITALQPRLSMAVLRLEFGLRRDEEGGFVSQLDHSLLDWAVVLLRRCVDVNKFPTALL